MKPGPKLISFCVLCLSIAGCINPAMQQAAKKPETAVDTIIPKPTVDSTVHIAAVGDMMLGTAYPNTNGLPPDSGKNSFKEALPDLREADIAFGNLEGVLLDTGAPSAMKLKFRSKPYLFKMPEYYGGIFKDAGFDMLSVGNNHSNDFGLLGRDNTMKVLDSLGIHYAGLKTSPTKIFTLNGVKYGFCAFSPNSQTVSLLDVEGAKAIIQNLKLQSDIVIVSFHGGGEGVAFEHVTQASESYKGERRGNVYAFAHAAIDAGADVILGNGPHVSRAMELYKDRLIAYSLGNFCTYRSVSVDGVCGLAPLLKLRIDKKGRFLGGNIVSYRQSHDRGLERDTLNRASRRIKMLTETDFGQPGLSISEDGAITPVTVN
ncbi:CapA family protein [Mucilaginibacter psychrotolerans]|nr:CapA family protein [Mucilaginibacter psychrotolerans]